ncbi:MAG: hypothetical protein DRI54_08700 [Bacteroidetes bacterium]|nr:MAG: hypothetical protein DRI54_08700 [Bacteroidota bacterium]
MKKLTIVLLSCLLSSSLIAQNFEEITNTQFDELSNVTFAFGDIDNDNDQDVLTIGFNGSDLIAKLFSNDGSGIYSEVPETPFKGVFMGSIAFADIDNDDDQDVLITGFVNSGPIIKLYINSGNGFFEEVNETPFYGIYGVYLSAIAFADIDNDSDQDVLITGYNGYQHIAKLYKNDGNGNFTEVDNTPFIGVIMGSIAFTDIDNDKDMDVMITGETSSQFITKLYTNDGSGNYTEVTNTPFVGVRWSSIAFADIDNDDDQDLFITGEYNQLEPIPISKLYFNDGNGHYTEITETYFEGVLKSSITFADIDNDDDQDLLITGENSLGQPITILYKNNGSGSFIELTETPFESIYWGNIALADIDNDNDQDVLITGTNNAGQSITKLYRNLTIVGINETTLFSSVSIYPNPNTGLININLGSLSDVSIKVLNVSGQLIYYKENIIIPIYQFELDASPGIYILELNAKGEKQQFKLVKN